jgi:ketosteroid isomerase-like protein
VLAPDAIWRESPELPGTNEVRGREAIRKFLVEFLGSWTEFRQEIEDVRVEGDRAALLIHLTAVGRASGAEVNTRYAHLWTVRDGLGVFVDAYRDQADALRALGAPETVGREAQIP